MVLSTHCTEGHEKHIMGLLDVKGAFLYGQAKRHVFVRLTDGRLAKFVKSLYGTRDAPQIWSDHMGDTLAKLGLERSVLILLFGSLLMVVYYSLFTSMIFS